MASLAMDKRQDETAFQIGDQWRPSIPEAGFEWREGKNFSAPDLWSEDFYLVPRAGDFRIANREGDLYADFANLRTDKDAVLEFANKYGSLFFIGEHFHSREGDTVAEGVSWQDWTIELERINQAMSLLTLVREKKAHLIGKKISELLRRGTPARLYLPPRQSNDPLVAAKQILACTINIMMASHLRFEQNCGVCENIQPVSNYRHTRAAVRFRGTSLQLKLRSSDLLTTVWLRFADDVCGSPKLKRCEAPDCGLYMNVTDCARPGARRMHNSCRERWAKRRQRTKRSKV
jgi:hypothetical protein